MSHALIIFAKNPVLGTVKTRLAKTIGIEKALLIYQQLLTHTRHISQMVEVDRFVFYSDFIDDRDGWIDYRKYLQVPGDLGVKMEAAFATVFALGYTKAVIIGSDCYELTTAVIEQAFVQLHRHDVVVGPALDGGYYLLGMKQPHPTLFANKNWSTPQVLPHTLANLTDLQLSHFMLPLLRDIDEEMDLIGTDLL
jgi:uncharacterized protein